MTVSRPRRRDDGFTLIELLIAMLCLAVILPAIVLTFEVSLSTTDETNNRLLDSADIQTAGAYVSGDVQNATGLSTTDSSTCVSPTYPVGVGGAVLFLSWSDQSVSPAVSHQVNYYQDTKHELIRTECIGGSLSSSLVLVHGLDTSTSPDVLCQPTACSSPSVPISVTLRGKTAASSQFFSLIGTRRTTG